MISPKALAGYRKRVASAWSQDTAHPGWPGTGPGLAAGQCGVTSAWLMERLKADHGIDGEIRLGHVDVNGQVFRDHCWLEADGVVVDLTADQFGLPEVVCGAPAGVAYRGLPCPPPVHPLEVLKAALGGEEVS